MIRGEDVQDTSFDDIAPGPALPRLAPGEVLLEEFMRPLGLTARALATELGVPGNRISSIVSGSRAITAETALLLPGASAPVPSCGCTYRRRMTWPWCGRKWRRNRRLAHQGCLSLL